MTKPKLSKTQTGIAGEYLVAGELALRGWIASLTLRNTAGVDILCSDAEAKRSVGIQVKASTMPTRKWLIDKKAETYFAANLYYVFVNLGDLAERPEYFVVPSTVVADFVTKAHQDWLSKPGPGGAKHKDSSMRNFVDPEGEYRERWDLLDNAGGVNVR